MMALVDENTGKYTENDAAEKIVVSQYVQAGREDISQSDVTIEKIKKGSDVNRPYQPDGTSIQTSDLNMPLLISGSQNAITKIGRASCREERVSTCRSRWSPSHEKKKETI